MTLDEIKARPSKRDRAKIKATTEEDIRRHMNGGRGTPERRTARGRHHLALVHHEAISYET
jgi:hypothetical protein